MHPTAWREPGKSWLLTPFAARRYPPDVANSDRKEPEARVDRRGFLTVAGVGAGVVATGAVGAAIGGKRKAGPGSKQPGGPDAEVAALFGELAQGGKVGEWSIERVYGVHYGAIPVVLASASGNRFQVDVLRRDPEGPEGIGNTESLSLFVANRGNGKRKTDERQGLGAIALADALAARQQSGAKAPTLMTLRQRNEKYPDAGFSVKL